MASKSSGVTRLLAKQRSNLARDLDVNRILPRLVRKGVFTPTEEREILSASDPRARTEIFLDLLSAKDSVAFREFCTSLESSCPQLLTRFLLDTSETISDEKNPTQALQLGFELALKERDEVLREKSRALEERDQALRQYQQLKDERDKLVASLENVSGKPQKVNNTKNNIESSNSTLDSRSSRSPNRKIKEKSPNMESESEVEEGGDNVVWQTHKVLLARVPGFGFGIAISGGRDNPHFANGDPSIAISDVLKAGPAEGKLLINDRVVSVNGISLENVDHSMAIAVMKGCEESINLVIRRRVVVPPSSEGETLPLKISLNRKHRKDEFGVVLGCKYFIKEIRGNSLAAQEGSLKEGDTILKINNIPVDTISLTEARKQMEKNKDKLQLIIAKKKSDSGHKRQNSSQRDDFPNNYNALKHPLETDNVNIYHPMPRVDNLYKGSQSHDAIHNIPNDHGYYGDRALDHYDGRQLDRDAPPRPPLPSAIHSDVPPRPPSPAVKDGYYSDRDGPYSRQRDGRHGERYSSQMDTRYHEEEPIKSHQRLSASANDFMDGVDHLPHQESDPRFVQFKKDEETGLGLRLAGGNATGIFIASVQADSAAEAEGLVEGDQILKANEREITGLTREEAVVYLTSLKGVVSMVVQYRKEEYDRIMASREAGDSFYIKTHFNYAESEPGELSFRIGEIFHIKDTLYRGVVGSWIALRVDRTGQESQKGIIPNQNRAEEMAANQVQNTSEKENTPTRSRGSLFRRKSGRRAKSLGRDHWEDVIFSDLRASLSTKFSAYEKVVYRHPGFVRPVVLFGSIADIGRNRLLKERPDLFESAQDEGHTFDDMKRGNSGIMKLGTLRNVISKEKHCLLDVTPHAVDRLNYAQYYPITIFLKAESKQNVKDLRSKWAKGSSKNAKKLLEQSQKLEKIYSHLFTGAISHSSTDSWYKALLEMLQTQQNSQIWMSEKAPEEDISDDVLFPMTNRLSFVTSPESELDLSRANDSDTLPRRKHGLVRSSSDPSVATAERVPGIPPYPSPPRYRDGAREKKSPHYEGRPHPGDRRDRVHSDSEGLTGRPEDRYYPSYYADSVSSQDRQPHPHSRANIDPYATLTPSERLRGRVPEDLFNPAEDRRSNPAAYTDHREPYRERVYSDSFSPPKGRVPPPGEVTALRVNIEAPQQKMHNDSSSYSSDSYSRHMARPDNKHDDSKLREKFAGSPRADKSGSHNPYRFTRSTANPVNASNVDKAKLSDLTAKYRRDDPLRPKASPNKAPSHHVPLKSLPEVDTPPQRRKEPPPVPPKTYTLAERGIEPDEYKMRNYENSGYNGYARQAPADTRYSRHQGETEQYPHHHAYGQYNEGYEGGPIGRSASITLNGTAREHPHNTLERQRSDGYVDRYRGNNGVGVGHERNDAYSRVHHGGEGDRYSRENLYDRPPPPRSFNNKTYMAVETEGENSLPATEHGYPSREGEKHVAQDSGYPSPMERPRDMGPVLDHRPLVNGHPPRQASRENLRDHQGSAFETYYKSPTGFSSFGKADARNGPTARTEDPGRVTMDRFEDPDISENHTVVATARGVFDHTGGTLESRETGVSIVVPEGAIPEGLSQELYFKVCKDSSILPPLDREKGETLLSPLVMCGPHGLKFLKPVELRLPHCASVNPDSWSFALKSSDSPTGHPTQWQNMTLAGMDGRVSQGRVGKNSVSVLVDHF